ncbi:MAG: tRNA uridine-5-carboxymethylaminomethyl(34) synthesis GTPase MnmE [Tannerellaceae bacterium]|jgi:tRNA modification GTPase|nr:tRNA uridine-5-carboxymethylaminomethyl(34) synthesis GTPase MnmE [Tannerellaceae bacterium]
MNQDTICAISTPPGTGGVAIIRLSGPQAIPIAHAVFLPRKKGKELLNQEAYTVNYGSIYGGNEPVDDVLASVFRNPHSFTGEDTVEIACHGSLYIQQQILRLLIDKGARTALPGEFTQRAFLNGKMDLSRAEAVADLIASTSAGMHKVALNQMRGGFSRKLSHLRDRLLRFASLIELELDFNEEDVEFASRTDLKQSASDIEKQIKQLADSFNTGNAVKNGVPVAIIGQTNAGKSTLLNLLAGEEKAIVSPIHGTTRDVIEDTVNLSGITFRFIDTAGLRETTDTIESLGIERTFGKLKQASIVLWVIDLSAPAAQTEQLAPLIIPCLEGKQTILVFNKSDLANAETIDTPPQLLIHLNAERICISAKNRKNTDRLKDRLVKAAAIPPIRQNDIIITNIRHYEALTKAQAAILRVLTGLDQNISADFLSQDIRECMHYLGEITGHISNDEILGNIFKHFCIGK